MNLVIYGCGLFYQNPKIKLLYIAINMNRMKKYEDFIENDKPEKKFKKKKTEKLKKVKKYSDLPLSVRKRMIQNMNHFPYADSNYYTKYGNSFSSG